MPRKARVELSEAVNAICHFSDDIKDGVLPPYTNDFYKKVSDSLNGNWTAHDVYTNFRENRRELKTKVYDELGIKEAVKTVISETSFESDEDEEVQFYSDDDEKSEFDTSFLNLKFQDTFDFCLRNELWQKIEPVRQIYKGREYLMLPPGQWTDIIADEFWYQFRHPCAFTFKKCNVSENPEQPYLRIQGRCKSKQCKNEFLGFVQDKPIPGTDVWMKVGCKDTRLNSHEPVKRQLRNKKRTNIAQEVVMEGAANYRRKLALKMQHLGNVGAPILYENEVLRKLIQQYNDKKLGVDPKDGINPVLTLQKLKYNPPYAGSIREIALDKFFMHYILHEQIFVYKEYCRFFEDYVTISIDSTGSIVLPLKIVDNIKSPHIFLYEIVINFSNTTLSVGQFLSAAQDTNTILYFLNEWLLSVSIRPKEVVCDYSRALLGGICRAFNHLSIKEYIQDCFFVLQNESDKNLVGLSFIRIDVAHFVAIFCRLKCFSSTNKAVKDFLIRCVALMISCQHFEEFQKIFLLTLMICIHQHGGQILNSSAPSPAEEARVQLLDLMANAKHNAIDPVIPDEDSPEFKLLMEKLSASGLDPNRDDFFINEQPESTERIDSWLKGLKLQAQEGQQIVHDRPNPYYLPAFFKHLSNLGTEFPLWTAVMKQHFNSKYIRPSSSHVEGDFNQLKNNILKGVQGAIRIDKFFKIHHEALKAQCLIASAKITEALMLPPKTIKNPRQVFHKYLENENIEHIENVQSLSSDELPSFNGNHHESPDMHSSVLTSSSDVDTTHTINEKSPVSFNNENHFKIPTVPNINWAINSDTDLHEKENWRNKGKKDDDLHVNNSLPDKNNNNNYAEDFEKRSKKVGNTIKRPFEFEDRKPTKFFRQGTDIKSIHNTATVSTKKFSSSSKHWLLTNGCRFTNPITVNSQKYIIKYTCPFDSIVQILQTSAMDYPEYLEHLTNTMNNSCQFIVLLVNSGASKAVYEQRCLILKDVVDPSRESDKYSNQKTTSPKILRSINAYSNVSEMWKFMMSEEPSAYRMIQCFCGNSQLENVSHFYLNGKIISKYGFKELEKAIIDKWGNTEHCKCGQKTLDTLKVNAHIFIDADVRKPDNLNISEKCRASELPRYITLYGVKYRLTGIILFNGSDHYTALCTRKMKKWEIYNDMSSTVTIADNKEIQPSGIIYIRILEE